MENIIEIKDLTFSYHDKLIFDKLNLEIKQGTFTTIIGSNDSGKSTLIKIVLGLIKTDSNITIDGKNIKYFDKNKIGFIPDNINDSIIMDTVIDEIMLNNDKINNDELDKLLKEFNLYEKKNENPKNLSDGEQQLMYLISYLLKKPSIIICDGSFNSVCSLMKDNILKKLKRLCNEKKITIINVTNDSEDILYGDYVVILYNNKVIFNDKKEILLNNEKLFRKVKLKVPFMSDVSLKLCYYGLLNNIETDMGRMINKLWK